MFEHFRCLYCRALLVAPAPAVGRSATCTSCGKTFRIAKLEPIPQAEPAADAPSRPAPDTEDEPPPRQTSRRRARDARWIAWMIFLVLASLLVLAHLASATQAETVLQQIALTADATYWMVTLYVIFRGIDRIVASRSGTVVALKSQEEQE